MLVWIWNFLKGYIILNVKGPFLERFINLCVKQNIYLWNIRRQKHEMTVCISAAGFRMLRPIAKKTRSRCRIKKKCGLPFVLHRHRKRKVLLCGFAAFFLFIFIMSSFVWVIDIDGNEKMTDSEVRILLKSCGMDTGMLKYKINQSEIKNQAILADDRLSWLWVDIKGTKAYVSVKEREIYQPEPEQTEPCDLVAQKSGVVKKITVKSGTAVVSPGDTVLEGQMLVNGLTAAMTPVPSDAEVIARVWYEKKATIGYEKKERSYTGEEKNRYSLCFDKYSLRLFFKTDAPYEDFDKTESISRMRLAGDFYLPFSLKKETYQKVETKSRTISRQEALKDAQDTLEGQLLNEVGPEVKIVSRYITSQDLGNNTLEVTYTAECEQNIAKKDDNIAREDSGNTAE